MCPDFYPGKKLGTYKIW